MKILQMVLLCLLISTCVAQTGASGALSAAPTRPKIVGVAHIGLRTDNLDAARKFYTGVLGFQEPFSLDKEPAEGTVAADLFQGERPSIHRNVPGVDGSED